MAQRRAKKPSSKPNTLYYGDNLDVLKRHVKDDSVDLVYLDPPFNSNRSYNVIFDRHDVVAEAAQIQAFDDCWHWTPMTEQQYTAYVGGGLPSPVADALTAFRTLLGENDAMAYLVNMAPRLVELHRVLKPNGTLYLHCDPTAGHYLKVLLDTIFGAENFLNEIVWHYQTSSGAPKKWLHKNHDLIFRYSKGDPHDVTWNHPKEPWPEATLKKWQTDENGRVYRVQNKFGKRYYIDPAGKLMDDVWSITLASRSHERLGYPTQKPLALLERIVAASSDEGDIVLDPFCGCGTTVAAAQKLGRRWIGIDVTYIAIDLIEKRLKHTYGDSITDVYNVDGIPRDLASAQALFERSTFDFERWAVSRINAQPNARQVGDKGVDGVARFPLGQNKIGRVLVSVKGGKTVGPSAVRDLAGTVQTQKAEMGVLVTMATPTRGVLDAVNHAGTFTHPGNGQVYPRIQVITIADLLAEKKPDLPPTITPYIAAGRAAPKAEQGELDI